MKLAMLIMTVVMSLSRFVFGGTNDQSAGTLLQPPIHLDELLVWRDGGSLGFKLSDSDQRRIAFCVDYRIGSPTTDYFFSGVTHGSQSGAQKLDLGSDAEKQLISYLETWLAANFTREQLAAISSAKDVEKLSKDEFKAWHVFGLVSNRAKAIERAKAKAQPDGSTNGALPHR